MFADIMTANKMTVYEMIVDKMTVDEITCCCWRMCESMSHLFKSNSWSYIIRRGDGIIWLQQNRQIMSF
jgi:hypothetical protein